MTQPPQNTSLSLSSRLAIYLGPPTVILLTSVASPRTGLLLPLTLLPTVYAYRQWSQSNKSNPSIRGELQPMIWTYAAAGTLGLAGVALTQIGVCKAVSYLLFYHDPQANKEFWTEFARGSLEGLTSEELVKRALIAWSWKNLVFSGALTFIAAGLGEEILKYLPIAYARRHGTAEERRKRDRAYLDYALAGALSFSLIENIGFLYASVETGNESWSRLGLSVFERVIVGGIGHLAMSALTALRAIRRDYYSDRLSWWEVIGPAALYHGAFDFVCFAASAWEGNVGWIHPSNLRVTSIMFGTCFGLVGTAIWQTNQEWKGLQARDRVQAVSEDEGKKNQDL